MSRRRDLTAAFVFLLLGVAACVGGSRLGFGSVRAPEPGFFPWLGGLALIGLSAALLVQAGCRRGAATGSTGAWTRPALLLAALVLYVPVLEPLGYLLATAGLCAVALRVMGVRVPAALSVALGLAAVTFILFRRVLGVDLPPGVLAFFG